jgi:hypothetical protein
MHKQRGFRRSVYLVFEWLKLVLTGQREKPRDKFTYSVDFKQFITSLMAWRTPWLVSADVKRQRQQLLVRDPSLTCSFLPLFTALSECIWRICIFWSDIQDCARRKWLLQRTC